MTTPNAKGWLEGGTGARDFADAYLSSLDLLNDRMRESIADHPVFGPIVAAMSDEELARQNEQSSERLRRAFDGAWDEYEANLRRDGATYAAVGVSLPSWYELVSVWSRELTPVIVTRFHDEPERLTRALVAMQRFLDKAMSTIADSYLDAKQAELRRSESQLSAILDGIADGVIATDAEGRVVRMNPVASTLTGWSGTEAVGRRLDEVCCTSSASTGAVTRLRQRSGATISIASTRAPIPGIAGTSPGEVIVLRDVTEEQRRTAELRQLDTLFREASWALCVADAGGTIDLANRAFAKLYRIDDPSGLRGRPIAELDLRGKLDLAQRSADQGGASFESEHARADGSTFPAQVELTRVPGREGVPVWAINVHDITDRRAAEALRARSAELESENRRVQEATRLKSEFLANMSHELRTPLNSIIGFAELLHLGEVGPLGDTQKEFIGDILASGRHLLRLINDVLDLSKVEAGKMEFVPETVDLRAILVEVTGVLGPVARERSIAIDVAIAPDVPSVQLDPSRLKQVLYNYLSNAIKFSPRGATVSVSARLEGPSSFRIEVRDAGPGIAPDDLPRLFVEFEQLDAGRAKSHSGTGLGLALTRRLVEAQGGTVGVASRVGEGSTFHVVLPLRSAGRQSLPQPRQIAGSSSSAARVLVIEDDPGDQDRIVAVLLAAGFAVDTAATGAQALRACEEHDYDAITLDLLLPDTNGLEILRALQASARCRDVPVIVVSVVSERVTGGFAVHDVLPKPLHTESLLASLARAGIRPPGDGPVLVVDDDGSSAKLMVQTLQQIGFRAVVARDGNEALSRARDERPCAVVLDVVMPNLDGFGFLERFRAEPAWARIPVFVWTVQDLSQAERAELMRRAEAVHAKDGRGARSLVETMRAHLPARARAAEDGT